MHLLHNNYHSICKTGKEAKRGLRIGTTPNCNGEAEQLFEQDRSSRFGPLSLRPSEGNSGTFSVAICEMGSSEGRHAAMHSGKMSEPLILPGRESAIGSKDVVARHESSPGNNQVLNSDREIGS